MNISAITDSVSYYASLARYRKAAEAAAGSPAAPGTQVGGRPVETFDPLPQAMLAMLSGGRQDLSNGSASVVRVDKGGTDISA